ncbi:MAG: sugar kinase [Rhodospirillales bacterium]|nr:sugar kinase [Rhodospirillales bacterium]MBO6786181.1 sugar kinase [Rhodospirillales bacterium]
MSGDILSIGECMVELAPAPGVAGGLFRQGFAGDTFNTAVYLARLQDRPVHYLTGIGEDALSDRLLDLCHDESIGTGPMRRLADRTLGLYLIETDADGERHFQYWRSHSAARAMFDGYDARAFTDALAPYSTLYLSGITLAILPPEHRRMLIGALAALKAGEKSPLIVFDPNFRPRLWQSPEDPVACYRAAAAVSDVVLCTEEDVGALFDGTGTRDLAMLWRTWGADTIVLRTGRTGSLVVDSDNVATPVEARFAGTPVDTTGGGDSFNAGFIAAYLDHASAAAAAAYGHLVAGHVVTCPGAIVPRARWDAVFPATRDEAITR